VNSYPTLDVTHELLKGEYTSSTPIVLQVSLSRDADDEDDEDDVSVVAPYFPGKKLANWWVVVGEQSTRQLLSIKRVTVSKSLNVKLEFTLPKGTHALKLSVTRMSARTTISIWNQSRWPKARIATATRVMNPMEAETRWRSRSKLAPPT
jgi:hypothetical protein